jgi:hypothetical protein
MVCEDAVAATCDPQEVLREAVSLMRQGRYAEALEKHLWFHDHALEYLPALGGVRLSFALDFWAELGTLYPEAMEALIAIRGRKVEALTDHKGSFESFHDVVAINRCLQEQTETVALFMMLHRHDPGLARRCYPIAEEYLVEQQEFEVCIAYLPDPIAKFEEIQALRRIQLEISDENPAFATSEFRDYTEMRFAEALRRLIVILVGVGQSRDAQRVRDLAVAVSTSAAVRKALDDTMDGP